jgi:hypothetical protein
VGSNPAEGAARSCGAPTPARLDLAPARPVRVGPRDGPGPYRGTVIVGTGGRCGTAEPRRTVDPRPRTACDRVVASRDRESIDDKQHARRKRAARPGRCPEGRSPVGSQEADPLHDPRHLRRPQPHVVHDRHGRRHREPLVLLAHARYRHRGGGGGRHHVRHRWALRRRLGTPPGPALPRTTERGRPGPHDMGRTGGRPGSGAGVDAVGAVEDHVRGERGVGEAGLP